MNRIAALALLGGLACSVQAADVGVSVSVSQPGVYGRIDIGRFPQPAVVVAQPVRVVPPRAVAVQPAEPVYLWVPPGHQRNWSRHCRRYNACDVPVYFVQDGWYRQHVMAPARRDGERGHDRGHRWDAERGHERGERGRGEGQRGGRGD